MSKICKVLFVLLCALLSLTSCTATNQSARESTPIPISQTRLLLDTYCTITLVAPEIDPFVSAVVSPDHYYQDYLEDAFALCSELEALLSITIEGSDVWRVNHAGGAEVTVDPRTIEVIKRGIEFGELSDGMFDITIGRLSRLWDFGSETASVPPSPELAQAQMTINYSRVTATENTLKLQDPEAWLDLGGIAKGYIADSIAFFLTQRGVEHALIDLGGDIVAIGDKFKGTPWRLGVRKPFAPADEYLEVIEVTGAAVVSSGVYERQFEQDGVLYHHILNPFTAIPAQSDIIGATIIAEDAVTGEGLSTLAILVGSERMQELCEKTPGFISAILILDTFEVLKFGE